MSLYVTKRDGRKELYNAEKIKSCIAWACEDLDVNILALESKFDQLLYDEIPTGVIHNNLIHKARALASYNDSDWVFVAGRLQTMIRWSETKSYDIDFIDYVKEQKLLGIYSHPGIDMYSDYQLNVLGEYIVQERDLDHSYGSVLTAEKKYLSDNECIQHMFMVNAMIIASIEKDAKVRLEKTKEIYDALSLRQISLATPWLSNLRKNGNISSCFILAVDDDIHSIFDNIKNSALISKNGGGLGISLAKIRAKGAPVNGNNKASGGVLGWCKLFNDTALFVNQESKRAGAFTISLPIWHRDFEDFLEIQSESGDQRNKSYDIFPQVGMYDAFMNAQAEEDGGYWYTFCPYEIKKELDITLDDKFGKEFNKAYKRCVSAYEKGKITNVGVYNAKELLKQIMKMQFETGLPYIAYLDTMNKTNPNKHDGFIPSANLCLVGDTKVKVKKAGVEIETTLKEINETFEPGLYEVYSFNTKTNKTEWKPITRSFLVQKEAKVIKITYEGKSITCTPEHKVYTTNRGYVEAQNLTKEDKLVIK